MNILKPSQVLAPLFSIFTKKMNILQAILLDFFYLFVIFTLISVPFVNISEPLQVLEVTDLLKPK